MSAWKLLSSPPCAHANASTIAVGLWLTGLVLNPAIGHAQNNSSSKVTVYGLVDLGVEVSRAGDGERWRMISGGSGGSRLGFQGVESLGHGLSAHFKLEQGFTPDNGLLAQGGRGFGREASVGISSQRMGSLSLGRIPMPYYLALSGIDAFAWTGSGGMLSLTQSGAASRQLLPLAITARADNSVSYVSPTWGGLEWRFMGAFAEKSATLGSFYSTSLRYRSGSWDALIAWARQQSARSGSGNVTAWTAGGNYDFGAFKLYAGWVNEQNNCTTCAGALTRTAGITGDRRSEFSMANLGVRVPMGKWRAYAQITRVMDRSDYMTDPGNRNATWMAIGTEYHFSKRTMIYATFGSIGNKNGSNYALGSGTSQQPANSVAADNPRSSTAVIGLRHRF